MDAYLRPTHTRLHRAADAVERSWSKMLVLGFCGGNRKQAANMGVPIHAGDITRVGLTAPFILGRFTTVVTASQRPRLQDRTDRYTTRTLRKRLATYGKPEFRSAPS